MQSATMILMRRGDTIMQQLRQDFLALGSTCMLQLYAEREVEAREAATAAMQEIARIEALLTLPPRYHTVANQ